ncbi:MAG: serine/threonine-protein kinase [Polyangiales bacterium]
MLDHPAIFAAAGLAALALLVALRRRAPREDIPGLDALVRAGDYDGAADLALEHDRPKVAIELLLRGQRLARAAGVASRGGDMRLAGELYERVEEFERAAQCYERAGNAAAAREARAKIKAAAPKLPEPRGPAAKPAPAREAQVSPERAQREAEECLGAGEIERAAAIYRDAGLYDEAVHLYANVLGLPGEAAPLVARLGNAERAAELYEVAGMRVEAARSWADIARSQRSPDELAKRVVRLDPEQGLSLLEELARGRPLSGDGVSIHFELAVVLADRGDAARALEIFGAIEGAHGAFRDVAERLRALRPAPAPRPPTPPPRDAYDEPFAASHEAGAIDLERIAREAASAAVARVRRASLRPGAIPETRVQLTLDVSGGRGSLAPGLEVRPVMTPLLADSAVRAAREGPSIAALTRFAGGRECDLGNIEVFYRLGLAHLANGDWDQAQRCFAEVDEASPGYRDAAQRASEVRAWRDAMGSRRTLAGAEPGAAGRYELQGELGRGGMAVVYRAVDTVLDRVVALKFLNEEASSSTELREMFQREARSVAHLNHPNIVTVYDFGSFESRAFLAMEFVEGVTVEQLIHSEGRLSVVEALRITLQVLDALEYAHARKIIHRDVKPSNMMRASSGVVKLMDFGLAKSIAGVDAKASVIAGTPAYMPPEQLYGRNVDHRADLYATAASLYEMLCGEAPFDSLDRSTAPTPLRQRHAEVPEVIERLVARGLATDLDARVPTAADFSRVIRRVLGRIERESLRPPASAERGEVEVIPMLSPPSPSLRALVPSEEPPRQAAVTVRHGEPRR